MKIKTLENMNLHRQNKNGDFIYHISFLDASGAPSSVPDDVSIELSTETGLGVFLAEYHANGQSSNCKASSGGLDIFVSLSRHPIGSGRMLVKVTKHVVVEGFDADVQNVCTKTTTDVLLWDGNSDGVLSVKGSIVIGE